MEMQNLGIWEKMKTHKRTLPPSYNLSLLCPSVLFWVSGSPERAFQGPASPVLKAPCAYLHPLPCTQEIMEAAPHPSPMRDFPF